VQGGVLPVDALLQRHTAAHRGLIDAVQQREALALTRLDTLHLFRSRTGSSPTPRKTWLIPAGREASLVEEGAPAPDFTLTSDSGEAVTLSSLRGKPVVLYFYPKDDTSGCTTQACGLRDVYTEFRARGAVLLGVSPDDEAAHVKFKEKYSLPFTLLADPEHEVAEEYGVWKERSTYGKKSMGIERSTFIIDADGTVTKAMRRVKPDTHAADVLAALP
jgi:thioredoxin-dependent peroxiredoxin